MTRWQECSSLGYCDFIESVGLLLIYTVMKKKLAKNFYTLVITTFVSCISKRESMKGLK